MTGFSAFKNGFEDERAATWRNIFERNQGTIKIKKAHFALPNLERIIGATLRISNHSSFHSMSLRDLSQAADISMGSLYSYIESKEQLSTMILGQVLYLVDTVLTAPPASAFAGRERLRWLLRTHVYLSEVMQPWFFFAYMEAKAFDPPVRRMAIDSELRTERLIADCLAAGQAAGAFAPVDPTMTASLVKPLLQDWYLKRWKYRGRGIDPDSYAAWVVRFVETFACPAGPERRQAPARAAECR